MKRVKVILVSVIFAVSCFSACTPSEGESVSAQIDATQPSTATFTDSPPYRYSRAYYRQHHDWK